MEIKSARFIVSAQDPSSYPVDGLPQIAVAGRSNVGKSSLLNMLTHRKKLVKTSQTPGKTQLINFFLVNEVRAAGPAGRAAPARKPDPASQAVPAGQAGLAGQADPAGQAFYLVDIPGFGYAQKGGDAKRNMEVAIEAFFNRSRALKGLLYLIDVRVTDSDIDKQAIAWLSDFGIPLLVVATKGDKLGKQEVKRALAEITARHGLPQPPILTSSDRKEGRAEVLEQMGILLWGEGEGESS